MICGNLPTQYTEGFPEQCLPTCPKLVQYGLTDYNIIERDIEAMNKLINPASKLGKLVRVLCGRHNLKKAVHELSRQANDCEGSIDVVLEDGNIWQLCGVEVREELTSAFE